MKKTKPQDTKMNGIETKAMLRGKFIAVNIYNKWDEISQNNTLIF